MSTGPELIRPIETRERNWIPLAIAAGAVVVIAVAVVLLMQHGKTNSGVSSPTASLDPYAGSLPITGLTMSESGNLAGGKVTYLDGHIANTGNSVVTGVSFQVLFRNAAHEVAQNETQNLKIIRTRDPYIDLEPLAAAPLKPGDQRDFRIIFDSVTPDWDGAYPDVRILRVIFQ